jgi:dephospho-CoA kinase
MSLVVGLTGGIGSGKTAASDAFARLGATVVDADLAARVVVAPGAPALAAIADHFGHGLILADGTLDRAALRQIVFSQPEERHWLEALTHPLIAQELLRQLTASTSPYTLLVSPLLFESGQHRLAQRTVVVDVPEAMQLERASLRDGNSPEQIRAIISAQMPREERLRRADDVLPNIGNRQDLERLVETLHQRYLALAAQSRPAS